MSDSLVSKRYTDICGDLSVGGGCHVASSIDIDGKLNIEGGVILKSGDFSLGGSLSVEQSIQAGDDTRIRRSAGVGSELTVFGQIAFGSNISGNLNCWMVT
jgi:hypothetical protein